MLRYKITSKIKPSLTIMEVTCDDFEWSKKNQLTMLAGSMHVNPDMQNHLLKFGIMDFDFVPINFTIKPAQTIEKAIVEPQLEKRNGKKGR